MDTLTHSLIGAAVSDGFFRRRLGPVATPFALAMSALPDIDAVTYLFAPEMAWAYHRGYTHSFFVQLLAAPALGWVGYRLSKRSGPFLLWGLLALLCLVIHTTIDLATSWGTMPFLPFSNARISWDVAPIIDLFTSAVTAASFVANRLLRWERVETFLNPLAYPFVHRHPRRRKAADVIGLVAAGLVTLYLLVGWQQNRQTVDIAREELAAAGVEAVEVRALPLMFTYVAWGIAARDGDGNIHNAVYSSHAPKPMRFTVHRTASDEFTRRSLATAEGRLFAWYSQGMYVADSEYDGEDHRVTLRDRRFFTLTRSHLSRFNVAFVEDGLGAMRSVRPTQLGFDGVDLREELRRLCNLTLHGEAVPGGGE